MLGFIDVLKHVGQTLCAAGCGSSQCEPVDFGARLRGSAALLGLSCLGRVEESQPLSTSRTEITCHLTPGVSR